MATTYSDTNTSQLVINKLTKTEYENLSSHSATELYLVPEPVDSVVTQNSTNPVQSNAVYQALQNHHDVIMMYFAHNHAYTVSLTDAYYDTTDEELVEQDPATWTGRTPQLPIITAGYYYDLLTGKIYYIENEGDLPVEVTDVEIQGDMNKLYIDLNTSKAYRWNGSAFMLLAANATNCLKQVDLSTYQATDGEIVQNIGSNVYGNGHIYKCVRRYATYTSTLPTSIDFPSPLNVFYHFGERKTLYSSGNGYLFLNYPPKQYDVIIPSSWEGIFSIIRVLRNTNSYTIYYSDPNNPEPVDIPLNPTTDSVLTDIYENKQGVKIIPSTTSIYKLEVKQLVEGITVTFDSFNNYVNQFIDILPVTKQDMLDLNNPTWLEDGAVAYELSEDDNIRSGWSLSELFKRIQYWFRSLAKVAKTGSYNDLTDKPQNATTTTAGLMSAEDKTYSTDLQSFGTPKIYSVATYKCVLLADITTFWNSSSSTLNLPLQGFVGFAIKFRDGGNIFNASADITAMVSYKNDGGADHKIFTTSNPKLTPHIVSYDNKIYITLDYEDVQNHYLKLLGTFHNCLSTPLQVNQSDCTLIE